MASKEIEFLERTYQQESRIPMGRYIVRESFHQVLIHQYDDIKNVGFDWRPNLMKKTLSAYLLSNENVFAAVEQYTTLLSYIVERIQDIRKFVNYTVPKNYKYSS